MQPLARENKITVRELINKLAAFSVFAYIISAISCEMVEDTAFISSIAIYLVFAVGIVFVILNDRMPINEYVILLAAFCLYVFIMVAAPNASLSMGKDIAYWLFTCVVLCILVFFMSSHIDNIVPIAMVAYIIGALILSIRVVIAYGGISQLVALASSQGENRVGHLLGNENAIGLFFSSGILCCLIFLIKTKKVFPKIILACAMLVLICMLLFTGSRKSLAFILIGSILTVFFSFRKERLDKKLVALAVLVASIAVIYIAITSLPAFSTINKRFELLFEGFLGSESSYATDIRRQQMIEQGFEAFCQKPLFGHGTGYSYTLFRTYSHNNFIELLMNYGLVGFCLYYGFHIYLIVRLWKQALKKDLYAVYFLVYLCVQLILGVGWVNYYERPAQVITALSFGYLTLIAKKSREGRVNNEDKELV